jgi:serine/threonine protein kinase
MADLNKSNGGFKQFEPAGFIGKEFGNITLMNMIGKGAMGAVFIGFQKSLKRKVAVKLFPKALPESTTMKLRFRDEAETVAILNHPNIIPVYDMGDTEDFLYIVMQLIEGEDLRTYIQRHLLHPVPAKRGVPLITGLSLMLPILDALRFAHDEGVIHRDIKPANIIIDTKQNRPFLADFGIASTQHSENDATDTILGTPLYIAPEQTWGHHIDQRADIYSTGLVLYELIAGKLPLSKRTLAEVIRLKMYSPEMLFTCTPSAASPQIDKPLEDIILHAIEPEVGKRYQSCATFLEDLTEYINNRKTSIS